MQHCKVLLAQMCMLGGSSDPSAYSQALTGCNLKSEISSAQVLPALASRIMRSMGQSRPSTSGRRIAGQVSIAELSCNVMPGTSRVTVLLP